MIMIKVDLLNDLLEEYKRYGFSDENFQKFVERTQDNKKNIVINKGDEK